MKRKFHARCERGEKVEITSKFYLSLLILDKASTGDIFLKAIDEGMITFHQDGISKILQGITTLEEVNRVIFDAMDG